ncbi:sialate O-acetylesterase [Nibricoccus sp. IMCC34717]|uniref:sialate O-acetylesterase n=1 Tax=Nibricoccus sp. IMCC34717 TaxID=3034021 RepID=UPI00384F3FD5
MKLPALLLASLAPVALLGSELRLHRLFQDHVVIQRDRDVVVFGTANPGSEVSVALSRGENVGRDSVKAGADGRWKARLPAVSTGAPLVLEAKSGAETVRVADILAGDVWLLSGQSNMEYKIRDGVTGPDSEPRAQSYPQIRYFGVSKRCSEREEADFDLGEWTVCSPEAVKAFSAVGYYFARRITTEVGVPIGLIEADWGGSSIEAWMLPELLAGFPHKVGTKIPEVERGELTLTQAGKLSEERAALLVKAVDESYEGLKAGAAKPDFDDSSWREVAFPSLPELPREIAWLRRSFEWQGEGQGATLNVGFPHERVTIFVNGTEVGRFLNKEAIAELPAGLLKRGRNVVTLRLCNPWWSPGLDAPTATFGVRSADGKTFTSLLGTWKLSTDLEPKLPVTWGMQQVNSALFRGMIAPLLAFQLKGILWYQGETNWDNPQEYAALFPAMIQDWRIRFGQGYLPFYFVQIANYGAPTEGVVDHSSAHVRVAQAAGLTVPRTGMVVTLDVGEPYDIHPKNKVAVGERLARHALRNDYGRQLNTDGPVYSGVEYKSGAAGVRFRASGALRTSDGAAPKCFALAGADGQWHTASAVIEGDTVVVTAAAVPQPVAVRYAWSGSPVVNLCDAEGLPAAPFRTDSQPAPF